MNVPTGTSPASAPIDLTLTPDFRLGSAQVRPSTCEVLCAQGPIRLQPRVMQVLVALAQESGTVVSRDNLRARCWASRTVGDDSINRCIQRLRRLADVEAPGAFVLETLPRLGYRVTSDRNAASPEPGSAGRRRRRGVVGPIAGGALFATAAVAAVVVSAWPTRWSVVSFKRLMSSPLIQGNPAISADGAFVAYAAGPNRSHRRLYLLSLGGGEPTPLTEGSGDETAPAWAPSGHRLAYVVQRPGQPCRLMVTTAPRGLPREVARCRGAQVSGVAWARSGDRLLFVDADEAERPTRIESVDFATGVRAAVTHPPVGQSDFRPLPSPDGRRLAFLRNASDLPHQIIVRVLATGAERILATADRDEAGYAWADDSRSIFVSRGVGAESALWSYPVDGGPPAMVGKIPLALGRLASGPGGRLVAEVRQVRVQAIQAPVATGGPPVVIDPANATTWSLAYAPDGTLAMISDRSGRTAIWLKKRGEAARQLVGVEGPGLGGLAWSPEGDRLAYLSSKDGKSAMHVISRGGVNLETIPLTAASVGWPAWSGDGGALLYPASDSHGWRLWRVTLARADRPIPLTGYGWSRVATLGRDIYGSRTDRPGIWRLAEPPSLTTREVLQTPQTGWGIFRTNIIFTREGEDAIFSVPIRGGPVRVLAHAPAANGLTDFDVDPISGTVTYTGETDDRTDLELFQLKKSL